MEYILAIDIEQAIWVSAVAIGTLALMAGVLDVNKKSIGSAICGFTGWGVMFILMYFLGKVID